MKFIAHLVSLLFTMFTIILSVSCAPAQTVTPAATPTLESAPTLSPAPSPTPVPTPTPLPTPVSLFSTERKAELNQQITDFINNQGDFTKEKKSEMAIGSETTEELGSTELGLADSQPKLEGYLFDYVEKNGSLILIMGFDGKDGKGFVTPIQIPLYFIEGSATKFYFLKSNFNTVLSPNDVASIVTNGNIREIFEYFDKLKERVIVIQPAFEKYPGSDGDFTGVVADYFAEHDSKIELAGALIDLVATNEIKIENYHKGDYGIIKLENMEDVENIDLSKVPMIEPAIIFF